MGEDLAEFHTELRTVARALLARSGAEPVPWSAVAAAGWPGLEAAEEFDGAAATVAEVAVLLTEVGRAAARTALPSVLALSVPALAALPADPARDRLLGDTVAGTTVPIVVLDADTWPCLPAFRVSGGPRGPVLDGAARFVLDAPAADLLLIPALDESDTSVLAVLTPDTVELTATPFVDATRDAAAITATAAPVRTIHPLPDPTALTTRAALALACDSLGSAEAMLEATVSYTRVREQFGRPIGSFQAVAHACADMLVRVTVSGQLVTDAIHALTAADPDAHLHAARAKAYATEAAVEVAGKAMQLHGGFGYTWESGIHTHLKRATLNRALFGTPARHRRTLATRYRPTP